MLSPYSGSRINAYRKFALNCSFKKFKRISGRPIRTANTVEIMTYRYTRNTIARGIVQPNNTNDPERLHIMMLNENSDTTESRSPIERDNELPTKLSTSC